MVPPRSSFAAPKICKAHEDKEKECQIMNKNINLQDVFLNQARKEQVMVKFILMNGYQFKGIVKAFDSYVVFLDCEGKQNVVYKHAISTIVPDRSINILDAAKNDHTEG